MSTILVKLKSGESRKFKDWPDTPGSFSRVRYHGGFVIVTDAWRMETAFPACDVQEVVVQRSKRKRKRQA